MLARDPRCTLRLRCNGAPSTEVDHRTPRTLGGTDDLHNLAGTCSPCHKVKTAAESAAARPKEKRADERHPGIV